MFYQKSGYKNTIPDGIEKIVNTFFKWNRRCVWISSNLISALITLVGQNIPRKNKTLLPYYSGIIEKRIIIFL